MVTLCNKILKGNLFKINNTGKFNIFYSRRGHDGGLKSANRLFLQQIFMSTLC